MGKEEFRLILVKKLNQAKRKEKKRVEEYENLLEQFYEHVM